MVQAFISRPLKLYSCACFLHLCIAARVQKRHFFACNKWFGLGMEDGLLERTLVAVENDPRGSYAQYQVSFAQNEVHTWG